MESICKFLDEPSSVVFKDEMPVESDPLILLPMTEYKKKIYLKFTLKTIPKEPVDPVLRPETLGVPAVSLKHPATVAPVLRPETLGVPAVSLKHPATVDEPESNIKRITNINNIIEYQRVKESIGFLVYCIKTCYPSIVVSGMINHKTMSNIILELNETDWSFTPVFSHDLSIKKKVLEETLNKIMYMKQNKDNTLTDAEMLELNKQYNTVISEISKVQMQLTPEILELENQININMLYKPIIGIFVEEINEDQLPKKNSNLKPISSAKYIDANK